MDYLLKHKKGVIGTVVFHLAILLILLFFGFFTPLPLPGEEGILVNFGNSENGFGEEEPAPAPEATVPEEKVETFQPPVQTPPPPKVQQPVAAKEEILTQDYEKTVALEQAKKKKEEEAKKQTEIERQKKLEEQRIITEREKQRQAELEKQRQAEIEKQRIAEAERKKREEEQRRIADINSRAKNAFGSGGAGDASSKSTGQGVAFPGGNQGSPDGSANAPNYGSGGGVGNGISFSLSGRSANSLPKPYYPGNEEGIVVVSVTVDKYGTVKSAEPGARGSNTYNSALLDAAKNAAMKAKFNPDETAPAFQQGTITYRFTLN